MYVRMKYIKERVEMFRKLLTVLCAVAVIFAFSAVNPTQLNAQGSKDSAEAVGSDSWPTGNMTIFVGAGAGSNLDIKAREIAKYLGPELGVSVVIENRPGAGGVTASTQYLTEKANTNNLMYMAGSYLSVAPIFTQTAYSSDDFIPVAGVDQVQNGFFVDANLGINNFEDLKAYAKDRTIKFASVGVTNDVFLISKVLLNKLGVVSDTVSGDSLPDCILKVKSGVADVTYCAMNLAKQYVEDGTLVALGAFTEDDYTGYADIGISSIPSVAGQGYDIVYSAMTYLAIRGGTDDAIVDKLYGALAAVYANPDFQSEMKTMGYEMLSETDPGAVQKKMVSVIENINKYADQLN